MIEFDLGSSSKSIEMRFTHFSTSVSASLEQFGKNLPPVSKEQAEAAFPGANLDSLVMGRKGSAGPKLTKEGQLEDMFGEQLAAQVG